MVQTRLTVLTQIADPRAEKLATAKSKFDHNRSMAIGRGRTAASRGGLDSDCHAHTAKNRKGVHEGLAPRRSARYLGYRKVKSRTASALLLHLGRAGRTLPYDVRGRGRLARTLTSLLLKAGAEPIVHCDMAAGHRLRVDCRVPSHCWAFFSGKYDDEKRSSLLSFLRPSGVALDVGANIGFYTVPMAIRAKEVGSRVIAVEPVAINAEWLRYNIALNGCLDITEVLEVALGNECGPGRDRARR